MKSMHRIVTICLGSVLLFLAGCKSDREAEPARVPSEAIRALGELRGRIELSDDQLVVAIERLAKSEAAWNDAIEAGLTTEEEIAKMLATLPETLGELDEMRAEMLTQDAMAAAVALTVLTHHHDGSAEEVLPSVRHVIARYYRSIVSSPSELEAGFIKKVDRMAERDEELAAMLGKEE
jgi:hypothetical protein